jgi:ArsR family transcriptional regulator
VALVAERFRILGEPLRILLLQTLREGERSVGELVAAVGSTQPNVSKHLRILQAAGLVGRRQERNTAFYAIADPSVFDLCAAVCDSVGARLVRTAELASQLRPVRRGR